MRQTPTATRTARIAGLTAGVLVLVGTPAVAVGVQHHARAQAETVYRTQVEEGEQAAYERGQEALAEQAQARLDLGAAIERAQGLLPASEGQASEETRAALAELLATAVALHDAEPALVSDPVTITPAPVLARDGRYPELTIQAPRAVTPAPSLMRLTALRVNDACAEVATSRLAWARDTLTAAVEAGNAAVEETLGTLDDAAHREALRASLARAEELLADQGAAPEVLAEQADTVEAATAEVRASHERYQVEQARVAEVRRQKQAAAAEQSVTASASNARPSTKGEAAAQTAPDMVGGAPVGSGAGETEAAPTPEFRLWVANRGWTPEIDARTGGATRVDQTIGYPGIVLMQHASAGGSAVPGTAGALVRLTGQASGLYRVIDTVGHIAAGDPVTDIPSQYDLIFVTCESGPSRMRMVAMERIGD